MARGAHFVRATSLICAGGTGIQAGVLEGAELLAASACFADVRRIAAGTVCYGARYTGCSGGVGLLRIAASKALKRGISLRACLAIYYAALVSVTAGIARFRI